MIRKIFITIFITALAIFDTNAQCTFERVYKYYPLNFIEPTYIISTSDGGTLSVMSCYYAPLYSSGNDIDMAIVKSDSCGNTLWQMHYGEPGLSDEASGCIETSDGNYMVAGTTEKGPAITNFRVVKFSKNGVVIWDSIYSGITESVCFGITKRKNKNTSFIYGYDITSQIGNTAFVLEIDDNGNTLKSKELKLRPLGYFVKLFQPNDSTYDLIKISHDTLYLVQTDTSFNIIFNKALFYTQLYYHDACISKDKKYITISAEFTDSSAFARENLVTIDINGVYSRRHVFTQNDTLPGVSSIAPTKDGGFLIGGYLLKVDSIFNFLNVSWYNSPRGGLNSIIELPNGSIIASGKTGLQDTVYGELYIIKTDSIGRYAKTAIREIKKGNESNLNIYPNPTTNELHIETTGTEKLTAQLFDITGKQVLSTLSFTKSANFFTETLSQGLYFARITDANGAVIKTQKIAVVR